MSPSSSECWGTHLAAPHHCPSAAGAWAATLWLSLFTRNTVNTKKSGMASTWENGCVYVDLWWCFSSWKNSSGWKAWWSRSDRSFVSACDAQNWLRRSSFLGGIHSKNYLEGSVHWVSWCLFLRHYGSRVGCKCRWDMDLAIQWMELWSTMRTGEGMSTTVGHWTLLLVTAFLPLLFTVLTSY